MKINAVLGKGQVCESEEGVLLVDTGAAPIELFAELDNVDDIYKKSITEGYLDHHTIDMLPIMNNEDKKCATKMVVDYPDSVLFYMKKNNIKELRTHKDSDLDAVCASWMVHYLSQNNKLPEIAQEMAEVVNQVDYATYRKPINEYISSFPGVMSAVMSSMKNEELGNIFSDPNLKGPDRRLNADGVARLQQIDNVVNGKVLGLLDVLAEEKQKNPSFSLESTDVKSFFVSRDDVDETIKSHIVKGVEEIRASQQRFEDSLKTAEKHDFEFINPQTNQSERGALVVMESKNPLETTNLGYGYFPKNTIIAVYAGKDRERGDMYDIGIAMESASVFADVMKKLCVKMNHMEMQKRDELRDKPFKSEEDKLLLQGLSDEREREAFDGAKGMGITTQDPSPLVAGGSLIPASRHSLIVSFQEFSAGLSKWAKNLRYNSNVNTGLQR